MLVPQHADSHFLADRHRGEASERQWMPAQFRPKPKFTPSLFSSPPTVSGGPLYGTTGWVSRIGLHRVGDDAALVEKRLQYGSRDGPNAAAPPG